MIRIPTACRIAMCLATAIALAGGAFAQGSAAATGRLAVAPRALDKLGIEIVDVQLGADNFLIGLRYRVREPVKASALVERNVQPVLVNDATGDRYYVPRMPARPGAPRQATQARPVQLGKVYSIMFANPDRKLRAGEKVTLYAGDSVLRNIEVQ